MRAFRLSPYSQRAMQFVLKLFPEILLKSGAIHRRMTMILQVNVQQVLQRLDPNIKVLREWDKLIVVSDDDSAENYQQVLDALRRIPGIQYILDVQVSSFNDAQHITQLTKQLWQHQLAGKSFCVRVRRTGQHPFSSLDLQRQIGECLYEECENGGVNLRQPDILIQVEVVKQQLFLVRTSHVGIGGYPLGTQESVLSLISGGFDSAVASYQFIRRGSRVHYCFFNLGGAEHQRGVQQMVNLLWQKFGSSHKVRFIAVDFSEVLADIVQHIPHGNQGVVLKRAMLRVAHRFAQRLEIPALVTGEALGQVASQTLTNLQVIDRASETVVMRPLIAWDKPDIIKLADEIGVRALAASIPEYCAAISSNPNVKTNLQKVEKDETRLCGQLLEQAIANAAWYDVSELASNTEPLARDGGSVCQAKQRARRLAAGDIIIDVRAPNEIEQKPFTHPEYKILQLPFYKLASEFPKLSQDKQYFLYCERGMMSKLQAMHLQERGFGNVRVFGT